MLISEIIEFKIRGLGLPGRACTSTTDYFYDKTKISKENLRGDHYSLLKYCSPTWAKPLTKLNQNARF